MATCSKFDIFAPQIRQLQHTRMTEAMERSGLTAKEGAALLGITPRTFQKRVSGESSWVFDDLTTLTKRLGLTTHQEIDRVFCCGGEIVSASDKFDFFLDSFMKHREQTGEDANARTSMFIEYGLAVGYAALLANEYGITYAQEALARMDPVLAVPVT